MKVIATLEVEDDDLIDEKHDAGITNKAWEDLADAVRHVGFALQDVEKE